MTKEIDHLFMYLLAIYIPSWEKCLFRSFVHFLIRLSFCCSFKSSSYILDTRCLSYIWFANIFFHSVGCLFIFLRVFFEAQQFLILKSSFFIFSLVAYPLGIISKNHSRSLRFPSMFSFRNFTILASTFRYMTHFELLFLFVCFFFSFGFIFIYSVR